MDIFNHDNIKKFGIYGTLAKEYKHFDLIYGPMKNRNPSRFYFYYSHTFQEDYLGVARATTMTSENLVRPEGDGHYIFIGDLELDFPESRIEGAFIANFINSQRRTTWNWNSSQVLVSRIFKNNENIYRFNFKPYNEFDPTNYWYDINFMVYFIRQTGEFSFEHINPEYFYYD